MATFETEVYMSIVCPQCNDHLQRIRYPKNKWMRSLMAYKAFFKEEYYCSGCDVVYRLRKVKKRKNTLYG